MSIWEWNEELRSAILTSVDAVRDVLSRPVGAKPSEEHLATAIEEGLQDIVSILLEDGAEIRPSYLTGAFNEDAKRGTSIARILLNNGAVPTWEHLEMVIQKGFEDIVLFLLSKNAPVNELHLSVAIEADVKYGTAIVKALIKHGAKPTGNHLNIAIINGSSGIVKILLENKADITRSTDVISDSLTLAIKTDHYFDTFMVDILIEYGEKLTVKHFEEAAWRLERFYICNLWKFIPCDIIPACFNVLLKTHISVCKSCETYRYDDLSVDLKRKSLEVLEVITIIPRIEQVNLFPKGSEAFELLQERYNFAILILSEFMPRDLCCLILEY